jgi:methylated-DNA-[protein]-cysteine S-methyltransferase
MGILYSPEGVRKITLSRESRVDILRMVNEPHNLVKHIDNQLGDLVKRLEDYLNGDVVTFSDTLDIDCATKFQQKVWNLTRSIPYGETRSYAWVSNKLGYNKRATRAVGQALGRNPLPIIIPCHRVIGSNGSLVGFSAGLALKEHLLKLEYGKRKK